MKAQVCMNLILTDTEYLILREIIDNVSRCMKYDKEEHAYYDNGDFLLKADSKEMKAITAIKKKLE